VEERARDPELLLDHPPQLLGVRQRAFAPALALRVQEPQIVEHARAPGEEARDQERVEENRLWPVGVQHDPVELLDASRLGLDRVAVPLHALAQQPQPRAARRVLRLQDVAVAPQRHDVLPLEVARQGLEEGRPVAAVDQVLPALDAHQHHDVHVGVRHVGAREARVEAQVAEQAVEVGVVGVAGAAEAVLLDAVQVLLQPRPPAQAGAAQPQELGEVLEGHALQLGRGQRLEQRAVGPRPPDAQ